LVADLERLGETIASSDLRPQSEAATGSVWWWRAHQLVVTVVDVLMLYPVWRARSWLPPPWGILFLFVVLACVAVSATLRLHLWFTSRVYPAELPAQRRRALSWTRLSDVGFSAVLLLGALGIAARHPEISTLFVAVAVASALASFLIEPATTRAAFRN
jgi:hypothetical protein